MIAGVGVLGISTTGVRGAAMAHQVERRARTLSTDIERAATLIEGHDRAVCRSRRLSNGVATHSAEADALILVARSVLEG